MPRETVVEELLYHAIPLPQILSYKSMLMLFVLLLESSLLSFAADAVDPSHTCFTKARETRTANPPPAFSVNLNLELEIFILFTLFFLDNSHVVRRSSMRNMNQKKTFPDPFRYIDGTSAFLIRIDPQSLIKSHVCCLLLTGKRFQEG